MNQRLVRFDVRLDKEAYVSAFWDEDHRGRYLLRPEIEWPLSVDPLVWPSVFFSKIFRGATNLPYGDYSDIEVDPETDDGKYWLNLEQMRAHYEVHRETRTGGIFVAIHLFSERPLSEDIIPYQEPGGIQCGLVLGRTNPDGCPAGSDFSDMTSPTARGSADCLTAAIPLTKENNWVMYGHRASTHSAC